MCLSILRSFNSVYLIASIDYSSAHLSLSLITPASSLFRFSSLFFLAKSTSSFNSLVSGLRIMCCIGALVATNSCFPYLGIFFLQHCFDCKIVNIFDGFITLDFGFLFNSRSAFSLCFYTSLFSRPSFCYNAFDKFYSILI